MSKPTIFFSHSSKDKDLVLSIKNKLDTYTGGVLDIFMSSDGQSIPFGTNWVHKVEEGLENSSIMFVFVTPNSIVSNWIYFEAGFAYSKEVKVIPVGLGINVSVLKAPLNLLQGFNISSPDGLNNLISVVNETFEYHFDEKFTDSDFSSIISHKENTINIIDFSQIFLSAEYELRGQYSDGKGGHLTNDIDSFFASILQYLEENSVQFSYNESYYDNSSDNNKCILVCGIKILFNVGYKYEMSKNIRSIENDKITFTISLHNFDKSFEIFDDMTRILEEKERIWLRFKLHKEYSFITRTEHLSAVISTLPEYFKFSEKSIGRYDYYSKGMNFGIHDSYGMGKAKSEFVLAISYNTKDTIASDIYELMQILLNNNIIYKFNM